MASDHGQRPSQGQGLPKKKSRQKKPPKPIAVPAIQKPLNQQIDIAFENLRNDLVVAQRFDGLARLAKAKLWGDPARPDDRAAEPGDELVWSLVLFGVTSMAAKELCQTDKAAAIEVVRAYIADVLPRAWAAGAPTPDLKGLAVENGLVRDLREDLDLVEAGPTESGPARPAPPARPVVNFSQSAPKAQKPTEQIEPKPASPLPAPIGAPTAPTQVRLVDTQPAPDAAPSTGPVEPAPPAEAPNSKPARGLAPRLDDAKAVVQYEEILQQCLASRQNKRKVILVAGLPTTGKSFLMQRLEHSLRRTHSRTTLKGLPSSSVQEISRTKDILLYKFSRIAKKTSPDNFDIYDMPGDLFAKLVRDGFVASAADMGQVRLLYAVAAFADAMVFITPALHILKPKEFLEKGDDDASLTHDLRLLRMEDMTQFVNSLSLMTKVFSLLRMKTKKALRTSWKRGKDPIAGRRDAVEAAIDEVLPMTFAEVDEIKVGRMNMPAMMLLSRADELERRLPRNRTDWYDRDPTLQVLLRAREHLDHLANRFDAFTVDFLTAQLNDSHTTIFDKERPSAGANGLMKEWLLPAIRACRTPAPIRALRSPSYAYFIRRHLDPDFAEAWARDENIG